MRKTLAWLLSGLMLLGGSAAAFVAYVKFGPRPLSEVQLRAAHRVRPDVRFLYRDADCNPVNFERFDRQMHRWGSRHAFAPDPNGKTATFTVMFEQHGSCPRAYPIVARMPALDALDLDGKRIISADLEGRPTLMSFFWVDCPPCIREVGALNALAARNPDINTVAVTWETAERARGFVAERGLRWRVIPAEQDYITRSGVPTYPTLKLYSANGQLLGTHSGGVSTASDVAALEEKLQAWLDEALSKRS
jgi:peroxiredoxin